MFSNLVTSPPGLEPSTGRAPLARALGTQRHGIVVWQRFGLEQAFKAPSDSIASVPSRATPMAAACIAHRTLQTGSLNWGCTQLQLPGGPNLTRRNSWN